MLPWLLYTYRHFGKITLLPIGAGKGAMVWGAVPYYLDMNSTAGKEFADVIAENSAVNPFVYWNWRVFGFLQYMWADYWDENLVHPIKLLKPYLALHHFIIIPTLVALPLLIWRGRPDHWLIAAFPIGVTYLAAPFHGLPRYAFPAIPFVVIAFACMVGMLIKGQKKAESVTLLERTVRAGGLFLAAPMAILVLYSTAFFSWKIAGQMSQYRLSKYLHIDSSDLRPLEEPLIFDGGSVTIANVSATKGGRLANNLDGPAIVKLTVPKNQTEGSVVTKVGIDVERSSYYDYVTVYWKRPLDVSFTEDRVYRPPASAFQKLTTVYIDADVTEMMIVPVYFRHQSFKVARITVQKLAACSNPRKSDRF